MSAFLIYILKVALLTAAFVLLYHILLRRDTFHRTARIVLVSSLLISYILPFCVITIHKPIALAENREMEVVQTPVTVPAAQDNQQAQPALQPSQVQMQPQLQSVTTTDANHRQIDWIAITAVIYALGVVILIALRLLSVQKVLRIIRRGQVSIERDGCKIVISKDNVRPFSWMRNIVLPESQADLSWTSSVVRHEQSHVSHHHSAELLATDILSAFQWFNPAVWLLRHDLCCVQEFEADASVLESGLDKVEYEKSLLSIATGGLSIPLVNGLGESYLRTRIRMMNRKHSRKSSLIKFIYLPVVLVVALILMSTTVYDKDEDKQILSEGRNFYMRFGDSPEFVDGYLNYRIADDVAVITGYQWEGREVIDKIPTSVTYEGIEYPVKVILSLGNAEFKELVIPEGITEIGHQAFMRCNNLENIIIPSTVEYIEPMTFMGCSNLKTVYFKDGLRSIPDGMFLNCRNLESVHLPLTLEKIGDGAFSDCRHLQEINLPKKLERIGNEAFYRCIRLSSVSLPKNLRYIGKGAFYDCRLMKVDTSRIKAEIGENAFYVEQL